jgi:hypothetical protein
MSTEVLVCAGCDRRVEWCAFCDREDCPVAICERCVQVELREEVAEPHGHGG